MSMIDNLIQIKEQNCCLLIIDILYNQMKPEKNQQKTPADALIIKALKQRLSFNNIYREFELITNMTRNLEIKFKIFARLSPLKNLDKSKIIEIVKSIPFLTYSRTMQRSQYQQIVKINYENSNRILLVTGITKEAVQQIVKQFLQISFVPNNLRMGTKIIATNGFWVTIETNSSEAAAQLKKFLRNKKKSNDSEQKQGYKVEGRRIRIVILEQDFLSILIDAMTQVKYEMFLKQFNLPNPMVERRKSQDEAIMLAQSKKKNIVYKSIILSSSYYSKSDIREEEFSDGFSQSNSLSSDILDSNKIKDLIETSEQGIQSQNNEQFYSQSHQNIQNVMVDSPQIQHQIKQIIIQMVQSIKSQQEVQIQPHQQPTSQTLQNQDFYSQSIESTKQNQALKQFSKETVGQEVSNEKDKKEKKMIQDDPFVAAEMFTTPKIQYPLSTAIQAQQIVLSKISFPQMKRCFKDFKNRRNTSQLIELPPWAKSESQEQRSRHQFFASLCRPKIIQKRLAIQ